MLCDNNAIIWREVGHVEIGGAMVGLNIMSYCGLPNESVLAIGWNGEGKRRYKREMEISDD